MDNDDLDLSYDMICLCCGGVNGEDHPGCSIRHYERADGTYDHLAWFQSPEYLGSVIVPAHYVLSEDHREFLKELAAQTLHVMVGAPKLYQTIMCDEQIGHVARLPPYDYRQFYN